MLVTDISFGHSASQAYVFEQFPNPSLSIWVTIFKALLLASTSPCGNKDKCETLAETNNIAEALGQAATQAPQPMQAAESKAVSAVSFSIGIAFASNSLPGIHRNKSTRLDNPVKLMFDLPQGL